MADSIERKIPHTVELRDRCHLIVSGVTDVDSFDEQGIIAYTQLGELSIRGEELHIIGLSIEAQELTVEGKISSLSYFDALPKGKGFFSRLLR